MGIFTTAIRNKKIRRILKKKNTSPYFHCVLLVIWPLTLTKRTHFSELSVSRFSTFHKNYTNFSLEIFYLHLQSSSTSRKWKNSNVVRFADLVHRARIDPSVTLRKFSPDTTGHGLRITKRPAVWHFSIFLFEK